MKEVEEKTKELEEKSEKSNKLMEDMKYDIWKLQEDISSNAKQAGDKVKVLHFQAIGVVLISIHYHSFVG